MKTPYETFTESVKEAMEQAQQGASNAVGNTDVSTFDPTALAAYDAIKHLGEAILILGLLLWIGRELYRVTKGEPADFLTPILKCFLIVVFLEGIGFLSSGFKIGIGFLSDKIFDENIQKNASLAYAVAFDFLSDPGLLDYVKALFDPIAWSCLITYFSMLAVAVAKMVMFDILWPVLIALVTLIGVVSFPLSMVPGLPGTMKGWFINMAELALWPIMFMLTSTLMFGFFSSNLKDLPNIRAQWKNVSELQEQLEDLENEREILVTYRAKEEEIKEINLKIEKVKAEIKSYNDKNQGKIFTLLRYLGINVAFFILCFAIPILSRMVIRGESAAEIGNMMGNAIQRTFQTVTMTVAMKGTRMAKGTPRKALGGAKIAHGAYKYLNKRLRG